MLSMIQTCNLKQKTSTINFVDMFKSKRNNSIFVRMEKYTNIGLVP